jgi:uncharacterized protein involved in exopolysaccharide biosynthesis
MNEHPTPGFSLPSNSHETGLAGDGDKPRSDEVSLLDLANVMLRHWRLVLGMPAILAVLVIIYSLLAPPRYTASVSFLAQSTDEQASRLSNLAARFGVTVPSGDAGYGPEFYTELVKTRTILRAIAGIEYERGDAGGSDVITGDLVELYGIGGRTSGERLERTIDRLQKQIVVRSSLETGVVTSEVTTRWAEISVQVAARILDLVTRFNLETHQSQASAERSFIEERVAEARQDLTLEEDSLKVFLEGNRRYENSPELLFEYERLERKVDLRPQVYSTLSASLEEAKIEEVRNTPVITIVEPAVMPVRRDPRNLLGRVLAALLLGGMLGVTGAFFREFARRARRAEAEDYREFTVLRSDLVRDLRLLWNRLRKPSKRQI